jgi:hypothetical protein
MIASIAFGVSAGSAVADEVLSMKNDTLGAVEVWIKSEHRGRDGWRNLSIPREREASITLKSPDRFEVVVRDSSRQEYHSGLVELRALIKANPGLVLRFLVEFSGYQRHSFPVLGRLWA